MLRVDADNGIDLSPSTMLSQGKRPESGVPEDLIGRSNPFPGLSTKVL
jgi:hypothetical protein